ncbi:MAG: hypothetical protein WD066_04335 [Planctomycetaceae bacterium]
MAFEVHAFVQDAADLDLTAMMNSVEQKMAGVADSLGCRDAPPTMAEMIRARRLGDFRPLLASSAVRIVRHGANRLEYERFVAESRRFTEFLVASGEDVRNVAFRRRRKDLPPHAITRSRPDSPGGWRRVPTSE